MRQGSASHGLKLIAGSLHSPNLASWCSSLPALALLPGLLAFILAIVLSWIRWPMASIHDEFSYLMLADTLRHGRLSNPTPDAWPAFQSFHTILVPTYSSKYPLGPGALLALGWILFGTPTAGLWLGAAMCAAASTWMLAGTLPRRWATVGGILVAVHPSMQFDWSRSYMNGWLTATAATIMIGAVLRLRRKESFASSFAFGAGIGLIALCRPFEGLIFSLICGVSLVWMWVRNGRRLSDVCHRFGTVACGSLPCLAIALSLIAAHNQATTGHWWRMPYQVHEQQYGAAPLFITQSLSVPDFASPGSNHMPVEFDKLNAWSCENYAKYSGVQGFMLGVYDRLIKVKEYWGLLFALIPFLAAFICIKAFLVRWSVLGICLMLFLTSFTHWIAPHYLAPIVPWLVLLSCLALRKIAKIIRCRPTTLTLPLVVSSVVTLLVLMVNSHKVESSEWARQRNKIETELARSGGQHLVFVRYDNRHNVHQEWVYNLAEFAHSPVLWARKGDTSWCEQVLAKYGATRTMWEVSVSSDQQPPTLVCLSHDRCP